MAFTGRFGEHRRIFAMIEPIPASPCNKVCSIDRQTGWCLGCWRSAAEIGAWPDLTAADRRALLTELARRQQQYG